VKSLPWPISRRLKLLVIASALLGIIAFVTFTVWQNRHSSKTTSSETPRHQKPATDPLEIMHEEYSDQN
jgi:hypothetical protein